ncbi:MAG: tetratricopeptide repeat protein [Termitinemataceae bacterium]|nr:MAG: tetratricopeptide repeat protein [Termitinemataceae bacterium]
MKNNVKAAGRFFVTVFVFGIIGGGVYFMYHYQQQKLSYNFAKRLLEYGPRKGVPRTIEDLQKAIALYESVQNDYIKTVSQTATYWKILGTRFADKQMYLEALDSFEKAIQYTPDDEVLHFLSATNAAYAAKSQHTQQLAMKYFDISQLAYKRAIELQSEYSQARYGLAVLYIYELNKPQDGIEQLLHYMEGRSNDAQAMMMMARALYMTGDFAGAVDWYDRAIPLSKDKTLATEAKNNRDTIRDMM